MLQRSYDLRINFRIDAAISIAKENMTKDVEKVCTLSSKKGMSSTIPLNY